MSIVQKPNADGSHSFVAVGNAREVMRLDEVRGASFGHAKFVTFFEDFLGDLIPDRFSGAKGSDAQAVLPTVVVGGENGIIRLTTGDAGTGTAADASSLTMGTNWVPNNGGLYIETSLKINSAITNVCLNFGFTDTVSTSTLEMPFTISGTTITSAAADAVCFVYDTAQTNDFFHLQGVKADTDTAINNSGVAPVADTFITLAIAVDSSGSATFYINGVAYGSVANAVTASTNLTPIIAAEARTTTSKVVDIDYLYITSLRG